MAFAPKPGCPMCGIVAAAGSAQTPSPPESSARPQVIWRDDNFTAYRETANPVSSKVHIVIALNLHVPSLYTLSSSDVPLLGNIKSLANYLLSSYLTPPGSSTPPVLQPDDSRMRIGFITPPFRDNKIPITDHLHAHAYILPADKLGWFRGVAYGPLAWYAIDDLIAEIRESVSNNRVKSGYENRRNAPIDTVPEAGARHGAPSGEEHIATAIAVQDVETGQKVPQAAQ